MSASHAQKFAQDLQESLEAQARAGEEVSGEDIQTFVFALRNAWAPWGCTDFTLSPHGLCCVQRYIYTHAITVGLDATGYQYRYCYHTYVEAKGALDDWKKANFEGEPEGFIVKK